MTGAAAPFDAWLVEPGFEAALERELGAPPHRSAATPRWPGVLTRPAHPARPEVVFARQVLPGVTQLHAPSVQTLADAAFALLFDTLAEGDEPIALHAFVPHPELYRTLASRAALLGSTFVELARTRRKRLHRRLLPADAPFRGGLLAQLALVGRTSLLVSCARPAPLPVGGWDLTPFPAGIAPVADDKTAPSRAYGKLEEAFAWMGCAPTAGQTVVDLGGSPGGWTWKALIRGAHVTAVDRAPLAPPARGHPQLNMIIGNALTWQPPTPVDWLLCDVICEPARSVEVIDRWAARRQCRRMIVTVKFKGRDDYGILSQIPGRLAPSGFVCRIKHLHRNRNEVEVMAAAID